MTTTSILASAESPAEAPAKPFTPPVTSTDLASSREKWDRVIRGILYALTFLLPLLFTPWTYEPLEFSKQILLFVLVSAALIVWLLKSLVLRSWQFVKTPLDLPIAVFLVVYFLASVFSVDRIASFLGFYGSFSGNFFQILFLVIFYYLVVNNFQTRQHLERFWGVLRFSVFLALIFVVLQFFGLFVIRLPLAKSESFNTIGGLLMVSLFSAFAILANLQLPSAARASWFGFYSGRLWRLLGTVAAFLVLLAVNFVYAWVAAAAGLVIYIIFQIIFSKAFVVKNLVTPLVMLVAIISFAAFQFVSPSISLRNLVRLNIPVEVRLDYATAMPVLKGIVTSRPVLGSGPGTFLYAFSEYRSADFNLSPFWNVRFDKAPSEAAEYLAGTGILGFLVFEALNLIFVFYALLHLFGKKDEPHRDMAIRFFAGYATLWFAHWFFFFNTVMLLMFWLMAAGFMVATRFLREDRDVNFLNFYFSQEDSPRQVVGAVSVVSLLLVLVAVFLFFTTSVYAADIYYRSGLAASNRAETFDRAGRNFEQAIRLNRFRPDYYFTYSEFLFLRINQELSKKNPNAGLIQQWLATSINTSRAAVDLSPNNWTAWERLANLYTNARPLVADVDQFIVESLLRATENDTKNPVLFTELGQVYRLAARKIDPAILGKGSDLDQDGLSDEQEKLFGSDPQNVDSNGNNALDGNEVLAGLNPAGAGSLSDDTLQKYVKTDKANLLKAEESFRTAIALKDDYGTAYYQLALTLKQEGKTEEAIAELQQALQKIPSDLVMKYELGALYFDSGRTAEAVRQFQEILAVAPNQGNVRYSLAISFEKLGMTKLAVDQYKILLEQNPGNAILQGKIDQLSPAPAKAKKK